MPASGSDLDGLVATYVPEWDSSDGWNQAISGLDRFFWDALGGLSRSSAPRPEITPILR